MPVISALKHIIGTCKGRRKKALELTFDNIANVPVADASSVSNWNTLFSLPAKGTPFTSVVVSGNTVKLYGGGNITIPRTPQVFSLVNTPHHISVIDYAKCIVALESFAFASSAAKSDNNVTTTFYLPGVITVGDNAFQINLALSTIYLPKCTNIGTTTGYDYVFQSLAGNIITLTIPAALMTCNGGNPDGDIADLQANNTVTIVQA